MNTTGSNLILALAIAFFVSGSSLLLAQFQAEQTLSKKAGANASVLLGADTFDDHQSNTHRYIRVIVASPYGR